MVSHPSFSVTQKRLKIIFYLAPIFTLLIFTRLFYWQIIKGPELQSKAIKQHSAISYLKARRGDILDSEGGVLAGTKNLYHLFVYKPQLEISQSELITRLTENLTPDSVGTAPADYKDLFLKRLSLSSNWVSLKHYVKPEDKDKISKLEIKGVGFEDEFVRYYPEASMSAHVLGFVGQDMAGEEQGYFGIEGFLDRTLRGRGGKIRTEKDVRGNPILVGDYQLLHSQEGNTIRTTIDKKVQFIVENKLKDGLAKYQASAGNVIVMESKTGKIRAMASFPNYDPQDFSAFPSNVYKNPNAADLFEPGSIFKVLIMAAGFNEKVVSPDTACDICAGPVVIGKYAIKTWDETYRAGSTMSDVIIHSDNTGMVFVARKLGRDKFADYLSKFGFGKHTGIELQEEVSGQIKEAKDLGDIDIATESFGQGIAVTPIQMITAVNTIANKGNRIRPTLLEENMPEPKDFLSVLSPEAVNQITEVMVKAVEQGEAKWAKP